MINGEESSLPLSWLIFTWPAKLSALSFSISLEEGKSQIEAEDVLCWVLTGILIHCILQH